MSTGHTEAAAAAASAASSYYKATTVTSVTGGAVAAVDGAINGNLWFALAGVTIGVLTLLLNAYRTRRELGYQAAREARERALARMREVEHLERLRVMRHGEDPPPTQPGLV